MSAEPLEITPKEAVAKLTSGATLLDVREPEEFALARIDGSQLVPINTVPAQLQTLEGMADEADLLVLCHHGVRSLQVAAWLRDKGIENCYSIAGGIDRWSLEVDPTVPRY
jgi:rhodanese-related sulfurtransferase